MSPLQPWFTPHPGEGLDQDADVLLAPAQDAELTRTSNAGRLRVVRAARDVGICWDAFVEFDASSTFCHLDGWRQTMVDSLGEEDRSLIAIDGNGEVQGLLPLIRVRSQLLGQYLVSMPFLNAGGPIGTPAARSMLVEAATRDAERLRVDLLELRSRQEIGDGMRRADRKITVQMPLSESREENWASLHSKVRSQVRRAQREELSIRFGADQRDAFYDVFARTMRTLGTPVLPARLFERIARRFPALVEFGVVWKGDEPIAAGCGFGWRDGFEITWAGSLREHKRIAPNMLLYWEFMERARVRGARLFDFGRCTPGSGTHSFKRQWGGVDVALPWAQWSVSHVMSTPSPEAGVFKLACACWRRLPLSVTNRVGPWLAVKLP